jgi:DNA-binding GntR family transcriptional regulator
MAHDKAFHEVTLRASGSRRLTTIVSQLRDHVRFRGASTVGRSRDLDAIGSEHVAILDALRARDPRAAAARCVRTCSRPAACSSRRRARPSPAGRGPTRSNG